MDNVSHTLVGAALGEAGLKKLTGLAMPTLMIAANIPDLDAIAIFTESALTFRRGWTHGPVGLLVLPALLTACMVGWDRLQQRRGTRPVGRLPVRPWQLLMLAYIGALSHPFLDWLNTYGIRLLMPFSHEWYYGDALFIIDPWLWLMMIGGIYFSRRRSRAGPARLSLTVLVVYIGLMITGSRIAHNFAEDELQARGFTPERIMAGPMPVDGFRRELIFDTGPAYGFGTITLLPRLDLSIEPDTLPTNFDHPSVVRAMRTRAIQDFLYWSRFPYFMLEERNGATFVTVHDARFSRRGMGWARVEVVVD